MKYTKEQIEKMPNYSKFLTDGIITRETESGKNLAVLSKNKGLIYWHPYQPDQMVIYSPYLATLFFSVNKAMPINIFEIYQNGYKDGLQAFEVMITVTNEIQYKTQIESDLKNNYLVCKAETEANIFDVELTEEIIHGFGYYSASRYQIENHPYLKVKPEKQNEVISQPAIALFCQMVNDAKIINDSDYTAKSDFIESVCERYSLTFKKRIRINYAWKRKDFSIEAKKIVEELIFPKIPKLDLNKINENEKMYG